MTASKTDARPLHSTIATQTAATPAPQKGQLPENPTYDVRASSPARPRRDEGPGPCPASSANPTRPEVAGRAPRRHASQPGADKMTKLLEVSPDEKFGAAHIPGALSIPLEQLRDRLSELPEAGDIVAYCRGAYCVLAYEAVDLLRSAGRSASRLNEGMLEWTLRGLPVETGRAA